MYCTEIAELPSLTEAKPLLPPRLEHFLVPPMSKAERAARAARVVRLVTIGLVVAFVVLATTVPTVTP